ncbi:hypothetical protein J6590_097012 [Homalodisca vitripennis]|nr:hypothetical protein J6590_097012 [Homalodisca vitripennis]
MGCARVCACVGGRGRRPASVCEKTPEWQGLHVMPSPPPQSAVTRDAYATCQLFQFYDRTPGRAANLASTEVAQRFNLAYIELQLRERCNKMVL